MMSIESRIEKNRCLKGLSTFGIGGKARYFISIRTVEELQQIAQFIRKEKLPFWVVGRGSNSLFDDRGVDGLVIVNKINFIHFEAPMVDVGAGVSLSLLAATMVKRGWGGLEFGVGIPGSVGGAIYMNAGAHGCEIKDQLASVTYVDLMGGVSQKERDALIFSYRSSPFQEMQGFIASGRFVLVKRGGEGEHKPLEMLAYRMRTQPYNEKSVGCVFRNFPDISAGALIDQCNLKGAKIGGAEVSVKHANFIVNKGGATAHDVLSLIMYIKGRVKGQTGRELKTEVCLVPYHPQV